MTPTGRGLPRGAGLFPCSGWEIPTWGGAPVRRILLAALCVSCFIALPAGATLMIDWVTVGDPGNTADTTGFGSVADTYLISR